ncbi:MAG TPA: hypothetical protein VF831_06860 [Anaerolineales bacterium]
MARKLLKLIYFVSFVLFPLLVMVLASQPLANIPLRMLVFFILSFGGALLFSRLWPRQGLGTALIITSLGYGTFYKIASFIPDVSAYPFSLGWSEASRYYYASLWLPKQLYGIFVPPSVLHPSRYLLQALPLLFPHSSLWLSRFWQVALWVVTASLTGWLLARRLTLAGQKRSLVITLCLITWAFLFLFQGPVYYHLLVMVILLLWGFDSRHFWRSLLLVLVASLWAGISRINWLPVPGLLAAALYLMEVNQARKPIWCYLVPPAAWVIAGTAVGYTSQLAYQLGSGNPVAWYGSSFSSDLLWYRLLPSATYPLGILPSAILVTLPLAGLLLWRFAQLRHLIHPIRWLGLAAILLVLFAGGVVVSVKIGGGSNLHNLDAYLALLLIIGSYVFFDRLLPDQVSPPAGQLVPPTANGLLKVGEAVLIAAALAIPLYFTLSVGGALPHHDYPAAESALQTLSASTQQVTSRGGEVLFISQRHLLTFNYIQDVPLVPDYELVFLMEMAMSNNASYLDAFHAEISQQRFAMIVSEPLVIQYQGRSHGFGEENDAWVERVSEPVLCYYQASQYLDSVGLVLYTPRLTPCQ